MRKISGNRLRCFCLETSRDDDDIYMIYIYIDIIQGL